jgi:putative redox protein
MEAHGTWNGGFATRLDDGRGHGVTVDLPEDEGGHDAGTSALELAVLSLAGCLTTIFALVAAKRRLRYDALRIDLEGIRPDGSPTIQRVAGTVEVRSEAPEDDIATVLRLTLRTCPVGVLFERAQIPVAITLKLIRPTRPR